MSLVVRDLLARRLEMKASDLFQMPCSVVLLRGSDVEYSLILLSKFYSYEAVSRKHGTIAHADHCCSF